MKISLKAARNICFVMMLIGIIALLGTAVSKIFFHVGNSSWQYMILPAQIAFFGVLFKNYNAAIKERKI